MSVSLDEYKRMKAKVDELKAKAARAEGAHEEAIKRLKDLGYDSVKDAEAGLSAKRAELAEAEKQYEDRMMEFKVKWGDKIL